MSSFVKFFQFSRLAKNQFQAALHLLIRWVAFRMNMSARFYTRGRRSFTLGAEKFDIIGGEALHWPAGKT
jgi:hypothetical protein